MSHDKINQHLEDMQYFPNDQFYGITKLCVRNGLIPRVRSEKGFHIREDKSSLIGCQESLELTCESVIFKKNIPRT